MLSLQLEKKGTDQLREILDILPRRGPKAMRVFYEVLLDCGEDIAADLLYPELAAQRKAKQAQKHVPLSGVQESREITGDMLAEDDELPESEIWVYFFNCLYFNFFGICIFSPLLIK